MVAYQKNFVIEQKERAVVTRWSRRLDGTGQDRDL